MASTPQVMLLVLILAAGCVGAADIAINGIPLRLQEDANKVVVTTNVTVNATGSNATDIDKARLTVPGSSDIRLQLQPDGLSDGSSLCQGRKCPSTIAVETLLEDQARTLNSTWDVLVEQPLERAKDALLLGLSQAWGRLRDGFSDAGNSIKQAANATVCYCARKIAEKHRRHMKEHNTVALIIGSIHAAAQHNNSVYAGQCSQVSGWWRGWGGRGCGAGLEGRRQGSG